jgi:hypothetical protein
VSFIVCVVLCAVFRLIVVLFCVMCYLFVVLCCVVNHCHRVKTHLQLINITLHYIRHDREPDTFIYHSQNYNCPLWRDAGRMFLGEWVSSVEFGNLTYFPSRGGWDVGSRT